MKTHIIDGSFRADPYLFSELFSSKHEALVVPLATLLQERPNKKSDLRLGVRVLPGENVHDLVPFFPLLDLVECFFPSFSDGRGYSQARLLREKLGFVGVLRAAGDVRRDQLHFLSEVGFTWFSLREGEDIENVLDGFHTFGVNYRDPITRIGKTNRGTV